jgi:hypothetical protein
VQFSASHSSFHISLCVKGDFRKFEVLPNFTMDAESFREFGKAAIDYLADYLENIRERSVVMHFYYISKKKAQIPEIKANSRHIFVLPCYTVTKTLSLSISEETFNLFLEIVSLYFWNVYKRHDLSSISVCGTHCE